MSEYLTINTEDAIAKPVPVEPLPLYDEDFNMLGDKMPEFVGTLPNPIMSNIVARMKVTMKKFGGIGLSANQCGFPHRVFVMGSEDNFVAFFNPEIINISKQEVHMIEGCLSFPFLGLRITRPAEIGVRYQDYTGEWKGTTLSGISARCFQHELDHMNGVIYTQRVKPMALQSGMQKRNKILKSLRLR
jgi:peptide deformylase